MPAGFGARGEWAILPDHAAKPLADVHRPLAVDRGAGRKQQRYRWGMGSSTGAALVFLAVSACANSGVHPSSDKQALPNEGGADGARAAALSERSSDTPDAAPPARRPSGESATAILGASLLVQAGRIRDPEASRLPEELGLAYARMREDEDSPASPVRARSTPSGEEDLLVYEPANGKSRSIVVFLHGLGGRFALPCWQIARAVAPSGWSTACPSVGAEGDWWSPRGEKITRDTVSHLREDGYDRFVLAGLSNGGVGATRLAPKMRGTFAALIAVSGADPSAASPSLPTLVVQGRKDTMASLSSARAYARSQKAKLVEIDAGHFALLLRASEVERAVADFAASLAP